MSKSILIINTPKDCEYCRLNSDGYCDVLQEYALLNEWVEDAPYYSLKEKGDCPLKPMPDKLDWKVGYAKDKNTCVIYNKNYVDGYNKCINEILGGTEDE